MKPSSGKPKVDRTFEPVRVGIECLFFVRTKQPVDPRELVEAICNDAKNCTDRQQRRSRFINRLTPVAIMGKATENGLEEVAKNVLAKHFQLAEQLTGETGDEAEEEKKEEKEKEKAEAEAPNQEPESEAAHSVREEGAHPSRCCCLRKKM